MVPAPLPRHFGAVGMGAVFDDDQVVLLGQGQDGVHVGHLVSQVDEDDGTRAGGERFLGGFWIEAVGEGINIDDDRDGAGSHGGSSGGLEGVGGDDDLIAPADIGSAAGHFHGDGAVDHRDGVAAALQLGKLFGKRFGLGAGIGVAAPPPGFDDFGDGVDVALVPDRPGGVGFGAGLRTTEDG